MGRSRRRRGHSAGRGGALVNLLLRLGCGVPGARPREDDYLLEVGGKGVCVCVLSLSLATTVTGRGGGEVGGGYGHLRVSGDGARGARRRLSSRTRDTTTTTTSSSAPLGLEGPLRQLLEALLPALLPEAALAQLRLGKDGTGHPGARSALLTGSRGSGKSTLVEAACGILGSSAQTLAVVRRVSCRELASALGRQRGHKGVFESLSQAFHAAVQACGTVHVPVLFLEDLDELCPCPGAGGEEAGGGAGEGGNYDERAALVSLLLEQLLREVGHSAFLATRRATAILTGASEKGQEEDEGRQQQALQAYFRGCVAVVATCQQEQQLSPRLRRAFFSHCVHVPLVRRKMRIPLLRLALGRGAPLAGGTEEAGTGALLLLLYTRSVCWRPWRGYRGGLLQWRAG